MPEICSLIRLEQAGQFVRRLLLALDQLLLVAIDRVCLQQGLLVVVTEQRHRAFGGRLVDAEHRQRLLRQLQAGMERLAHQPIHVTVHQQMRVPAVARARQDREVGKVALHHLNRAQHSRRIVQRHHQQLRLFGAGRAQHVGARGIAEIHLGAEAADHFDLAGVAFQRGELDAVHAQHAADDLPEAAEAADDHRRRIRIDRVVLRAAACGFSAQRTLRRRRTGSALRPSRRR